MMFEHSHDGKPCTDEECKVPGENVMIGKRMRYQHTHDMQPCTRGADCALPGDFHHPEGRAVDWTVSAQERLAAFLLTEQAAADRIAADRIADGRLSSDDSDYGEYLVAHGPVKPPYGTPERAEHDARHETPGLAIPLIADLGTVLGFGRAPAPPMRRLMTSIVTELVAEARQAFPPVSDESWFVNLREALLELPLTVIEVDAVMAVVVTMLDGCPVHGYGREPHGSEHDAHRKAAANREWERDE